MRLVKSITPFLLLLIVCLMTPLVAAAASAETVPMVDYAYQAPLWVQVGLAGLATGLTVQMMAKNPDTGEEERIQFDSEDEDTFLKRLQHFVGLKSKAKVKPVQEKLDATEKENDGLRGMIVGEILRIKKLTSVDDEGEPTFDVEKEQKYLEGLPADRLKMEYERLPKREELKVEQVTTSEEPDDSPDGLYAELAPEEDE